MGTRHLCSTMWMAPCPSTLAPTSLRMTTGWFGTQTASTSQTGEGPSAAGAMHRWGCHPKPLARPLTPVTRTQIAWRVSSSVLGQERGRIFLPCLSCPSLLFHGIFTVLTLPWDHVRVQHLLTAGLQLTPWEPGHPSV